jgi:hypothetical protein
MSTINANQLNQKIIALPDHLLQEVNNYIDYLTYKSEEKDWSINLTKEQSLLIEKGKKDIEENRVISHNEARKRIENYIKNKSF